MIKFQVTLKYKWQLSQIKTSNIHYTCGSTSKRVTNGLAPGNTGLMKSRSGGKLGNTLSILTSTVIERMTSRTDRNVSNHLAKQPFSILLF